MPLNVAQLNIGVSADTNAASTALAQLQQQFGTVAQAAVSGASAEAAGQQQVVQALGDTTQALNGVVTAIQGQAAASSAAVSTVTSGANATQASLMGMGATGSSALMSINQAMLASGQSIGPLNSGIMLIATNLRFIPSNANTAKMALFGVGLALTAIGVASAAIGAPAQQGLQQLQQAYTDIGQSIDQYSQKIDEAKQHGADLGITQDQIYQALARLTRGLNDPALALQYLTTAEDLAAASGRSLASVSFDLVRAFEGYGRGLKQYGIDIVFTHNAQAGLDSAMKASANTADQVTAAEARLSDAQQRATITAERQAAAVDQVAMATQRVNDAEQSYAQTIRTIAAQNQVPQHTALAAAKQSLADAIQRLSDLNAKEAAKDEVPQLTHTATATRLLADARQRLIDMTARLSEQHELSVVDYDRMAQSADRVAEAQEAMALATGGGIITAQNALRHAISQQREELDRLHQKQIMSLSEQQQLAKAKQDVARQERDLIIARQTDRGDADLKRIESAIQLRDATQAVTKARQALNLEIIKDQSATTMRQIQDQNQLTSAYKQVRDALQALDHARRAAAVPGASAGAAISVGAAQRGVDHAKKVHAEAVEQVTDAQEKVKKEHEQHLKALQLLAAKVEGAADAAARGWTGALNSIKAHFLNWLADFGNAGGRFATFALPFLLAASMMRKAFTGLGGMITGAFAHAHDGGLRLRLMYLWDAVKQGGSHLLELGKGALSWSRDAIIAAASTAKNVAILVAQKAAALASAIASKAMAAAQWLVNAAMDANPVMLVVAAIAALAAGVIYAYTHFAWFRDAVDAVGRAFKWFGEIVWNAVTTVFDWIKDHWPLLLAILTGPVGLAIYFVKSHFKEIKEIVVRVFDDVVGFFKELPGNILHALATFGNDLKNLFVNAGAAVYSTVVNVGTNIVTSLVNGIGGAASKIWDFFTSTLPTSIWNAVQGLWATGSDIFNAGWNLLSGLVNGIIKGAKDLIGGLFSAGGEIAVDLWNAVVDMWNYLSDIGGNIISGLINGVVNAGTRLKDGFLNVVKGAWQGVKDFFGFGSPSRLTHQHGQWIVDGFINGMAARQSEAVAQAKRLSQAMNDELQAKGKIDVALAGGGGVGAANGARIFILQMQPGAIKVEGSVISERDLALALREHLIIENDRSGGTFLPFTPTRT